MIDTVDNYSSELADTERYFFKVGTQDKKLIDNGLEITVSDYLQKISNPIFSFSKDEKKLIKRNGSDIIISVKKNADGNQTDPYLVKIGNYIGKFFWDGLEINIGSRFSEEFLARMLNFANDVYLDDVDVSGAVSKNYNSNISKLILYYLFVQSLEQAYLLGLPKTYTSIEHHGINLRGQINVSAFIRKDIPFKGMISSTSREQKEVQELVDVLYKAVKIIEDEVKRKVITFSTKNISHIKTHLKEVSSNQLVSTEVIRKALQSKSLQNPIFAPYKKVLEYAKTIIANHRIEEKKDGNNKHYGFIINVAELFEIYITKLLRKEFVGWMVESPELPLYADNFFARKIIPDIVMSRGQDVMVFDTKYKRMKMDGNSQNGMGDVDRMDFFQINTYMSYYQNHNYNLIAGGLLYPMGKFDEDKCYSGDWLGKNDSKFIIDGIDFSQLQGNDFAEIERDFVSRISKLIGRNHIQEQLWSASA